MVVECPICSKVLNNEQFCPYCGTNINEEIPTDFTSFQKLKNLFSDVFGSALSKKDLDEFLSKNESKIANFIKKYQNPFEELVLDISAIKQDNKSIYGEISKITTYFEDKRFNLSISQRKLCYTFKRIYEELDDIIAKKNKEYCIKIYDDVDGDIRKLNDFLVSDDYISKDKLSYKSQFKSSYDLIKPVNDYVGDNSDILTKSQKESIASFISNFDNFDKKVDELNSIYTLNQNLDSIIDLSSKISKSEDVDELQKEKTAYNELYNIAIEILEEDNSLQLLDKIEDNKDALNNFKTSYESLDSKIQQKKKEEIKNYLNENRDAFVKFNTLKTSKITAHIDADVIRNKYEKFHDKCLEFNLDLLDSSDLELVNEFKSNYEDVGNIVKYVNNRFDIDEFLAPISNFVLGNSVDVLEKQKTDFKDLFESCDSFISRLNEDLLESEILKIDNFKRDYLSIDETISKIKVNNWLNSNENKLQNFNNEIGKEISHVISNEEIENLKKKTKNLYDDTIEIQNHYEVLSQNEIISSFVYNFENLDDIIADKNCKFKIKQILDKINKREFKSDSVYELEKQKELFSKCFDVAKKIIDSFNDRIDDSQKDEFLKFIEEYDKLDDEICNLKIDSFFNKHLKEINNFINFTKRSRKYEISDKKRDERKNEVSYFYEDCLKINDVFDKNPNIKQINKILEFIETYENFENIIQKINYQIWFSNNLDDINKFLAIKSKDIDSYISDDKKDILKAPEECYNKLKQIVDFHDNVLSLDIDLNIVNDFINDYDNYDNIIDKLNIELFIKNNFEVIMWVVALNKVKAFYVIDDEEKEKYRNNIQKIYSDLTKIKQFCVKNPILDANKVELINRAIKNYDDVDELVNKWNENYYLICHVKEFARIGEFTPDNYFSNNWKQDLLKWYENVLPSVKKLKKDYGNYISPKDEKLFEKFFNKSKTFEKDTKKANELYVAQELKDNSDLFDDLDGKSLDNQQRDSIVIDEDALRVIAGAGSGKTLTIQGKVKYLTTKRNIDPSEILAISFSNASVGDLKERITEPIDIKTFHKVGKDILTQYDQYSKPDEFALNNIIKGYLTKKAFNDNEISKKLIEFFSFYINIPPSDDDVKYVGDLLEWQEGVDFSTLKQKFKNEARETLNNEIVRSYEELYIANFLFIHNIDYTYEKIYTYVNKNFDKEFNKFKNLLFSSDLDIPNELKDDITKDLLKLTDISRKHEIKNYAPDFYLNDYGIYIEHFGLNRNCENHLIGRKSSEEYVEEMNWKREEHKKHGTTLIETFSYYQSENRLLTRLAEKLEAQGVKFGEIDYVHVYKKLQENNAIKEWKDFIKLLKTFIELFKGNNYNENKFKEFYNHANENMDGFLKERSIAFLEIVEEVYKDYEEYLLKIKKIDFNDMINKASDCIVKYGLDSSYKYIIVDEYQDTSFTRYNLLKKIHDTIGAKIMIVGDDWQSIYSFTGCDVNIFTKFDTFFDVCETRFIETTYRNSQQLINATSNFVMQNPEQTKKNLKSFKSLNSPIKLVKFSNDSDEILKLELIIRNILEESKFKNKKILILGRNNKDIFYLLDNPRVKDEDIKRKFDILGNEDKLKNDKFLKIRYNDNPSLNIEYRTVHQSKGLESDNVILINLKNKKAGFPNKMVDDPVLDFVKRNLDSFDHAEERRLFYVALTRTKNNVYLLAPHFKTSIFVEELEDDVNVELLNLGNGIKTLKDFEKNGEGYVVPTKLKCPVCKTGMVLLEAFWNDGKFHKVFKCSNNMTPPYKRCSWEGGYYGSELKDLDDIKHCPKCEGILIRRYRRIDGHPFFGCTNYSKTKCNGKKSPEPIGRNCPECGKPLVKRVNSQDDSLFIGCSGYPSCRYTENLS